MKASDETLESLTRVEVAAARGTAAALATRPQQTPGWQAIAVAVAILGSIVWFGIDFSGRLGRIEGQLTILMQTVQEGRSRSERGEVPEFQPALPVGAGNASVQDARKRPGS